MTALSRYFRDFAAWVKGRNRFTPLGLGHTGRSLRLIPVGLDKPQAYPIESWTQRKAAFDRAQRSHHGRGAAGKAFRKKTQADLIEEMFTDEAKGLELIERIPRLLRDPCALEAAVKAIARLHVAEARR